MDRYPRRVRQKISHNPSFREVQILRRPVVNNGDIDMVATEDSSDSSTCTVDSHRHYGFVVALDFGTALTSVSYTKFDPEARPSSISTRDIRSIRNWRANGDHDVVVPSESRYVDNHYQWGYQVRSQAILAQEKEGASYNVIRFSKLLLNDSDRIRYTDELLQVENTLNELHKTPVDVVEDFLLEVLKHAKLQLMERDDFCDECQLELTLCVPSGWTSKATFRFTNIIEKVTKEINFRGSFFDIFIIEEPEAAAACVLQEHSLRDKFRAGQVFLVCDAGGGTVDTITYEVKQEHPFRLIEIIPTDGRDCGSGYINQALIHDARQRLKDEVYLEDLHGSLERLLENTIYVAFEYDIKRGFGPDAHSVLDISIPGLKANENKNFGKNVFHLTRDKIHGFFRLSLDETTKQIEAQLSAARAKNRLVQNILLVGGFSTSKALRHHLAARCDQLGLMYPEEHLSMQTVVSHGGVIRALNKEDGPIRKTKVNIGFFVIETRDRSIPAHKSRRDAFEQELDGNWYFDSIDWVIRKNQILGDQHVIRTPFFQVYDAHNQDDLIADQKLYYSDCNVSQHYHPQDQRKNKGAETLVVVKANFNFLRDQNLIEPQNGREPGSKIYKIDYEVVLLVNGRNIKAWLCYPPGPDGQRYGEVNANIAFAFSPGTK